MPAGYHTGGFLFFRQRVIVPMTDLRRGRIYNAFLGRHARGTEPGKKPGDAGPYRHAIIVSNSNINEGRDRVTIAPIFNYKLDGKELHLNWGFWLPKSDVEEAYLNEDNFADCGQLWTVFCPHTSKEAKQTLPHDVNLDFSNGYRGYRGTLKYRERLDLALQIVINDRIIISQETRTSKFGHVPMQGDVVELDLPNHHERAQALVISAPGIDNLRNLIRLKSTNQPLNHITVVPLIKNYNSKETAGLVSIETHTESNVILGWQAVCYEIYTIDWKERRHKVIGTVRNMNNVIRNLRQYLDLPALAPASLVASDEPGTFVPAEKHLVGEELAAEIRRVNELSKSLGLAYRSIQQDSQQEYLSHWEPDESSAEQPIVHVSGVAGIVDSIMNLIEIRLTSFQPVQLAVPSKAGVADSIEPFPREQPLPLEWFDGQAVFLRFHRGPAGNWSVSRTGLTEELILELWSRNEQPLGPPLRVGDRLVPLPTEGLEDLSTIKIRLASAQESKDE